MNAVQLFDAQLVRHMIGNGSSTDRRDVAYFIFDEQT